VVIFEMVMSSSREALISPFKIKEWPREFGRWILVEHEDTRTLCNKEQVGEEPWQ
jgi:hypothetical protein